MPIYEYQCEGCGGRFEEFMRHNDPQPDCPDCGDSRVKRLISSTSFQLKGSGWYVTDYAGSAGRDSKSKPDEAGEKGKGKAKDQAKDQADTAKTESGATSPSKPPGESGSPSTKTSSADTAA